MSSNRTQIELAPNVLRWARERVPLTVEALAKKLHVSEEKVHSWETTGQISVAQANNLARVTYTPLGYLYLLTPPAEELPITDFRAIQQDRPENASPNLLDTVMDMQRRQAWMRDELIADGLSPLSFVGSSTVASDPKQTAESMRDALGLDVGWASKLSTWTEALRHLKEAMEAAGILVVFSGIVRNNTHRKLDVEEFRGFALSDDYAPLVFVNSADAKAAQMFTLAHECAHLWIGVSGVSNLVQMKPTGHEIERWCNSVAAEFLVPRDPFLTKWREGHPGTRLSDLARHFKVSTVVAARRALDFNLISDAEYRAVYEESKDRVNGHSGGHFWNTQNVRIGRRFGGAVARAVKEGRLLYRDAYELTGLRGSTFDKYIESVG